MMSLEGKDGVLSIFSVPQVPSLCHGYSQGDVPDRGTRVLVVTDNAKARGNVLARALGEEVREKRGQWGPPFLTLDEAIDEAYATPRGRSSSPIHPITPAEARRRTIPT
jgi:microcystin degradation protein MlrC